MLGGWTKRGTAALLLALALLLGACAPTIPSNYAEREARAKKLGNLVALPATVEICELTAGGMKEQRDDWCAVGKKHIESALAEILREKGYALKPWKGGGRAEQEVAEIRPLYRAVMNSIYSHAIFRDGGDNLNFFPERSKNFDYTLGPLDKVLAEHKGDGLLLVRGEDEISSAGRKALQVVRSINPFDQPDRAGVTWVEVALADRSGDILWFGSLSNAGGYDLRDPDSARKFVRQALDDFPEAGK
jgi:hypothetical protein